MKLEEIEKGMTVRIVSYELPEYIGRIGIVDSIVKRGRKWWINVLSNDPWPVMLVCYPEDLGEV